MCYFINMAQFCWRINRIRLNFKRRWFVDINCKTLDRSIISRKMIVKGTINLPPPLISVPMNKTIYFVIIPLWVYLTRPVRHKWHAFNQYKRNIPWGKICRLSKIYQISLQDVIGQLRGTSCIPIPTVQHIPILLG